MAYRIEDGTGSRNKAAVFTNRLRTFAEERSLVNLQSVKSGNITQEEILNGEVIGVFTAMASTFKNSFGTPRILSILSIINNDPVNLMVIDRAYVQISSSTITLPNSNLILVIDNQFVTNAANRTSVPIINDNQYSTIIPLVTASTTTIIDTQSIADINIIRTAPTLGDTIELIPPGSNAIILGPAKTISTTANYTRASNVFSLSLFNNSASSININSEAFIRFAMIHPGDTG